MRARIALVVLIALEALALAVVATRVPVPAPVDWSDPGGWLRRTDPETATLVIGRLLAVAVAAWLLATTLLALAVRAVVAAPRLPARLRRATGRAGRIAPAAVRHVVEAAFAVGVGATAVVPAGAATVPQRERPVAVARPLLAPLAPVRDGRTVVPVAPGTPAAPAAPTPAAAAAADVAAPGRPPAPAGWDHHRVAPGEHLWGIAEATVHAAGIDDPTTVDRYWHTLCDANRDHLASGDPNLIAPDEDLDLPPVA